MLVLYEMVKEFRGGWEGGKEEGGRREEEGREGGKEEGEKEEGGRREGEKEGSLTLRSSQWIQMIPFLRPEGI